MDLVDELKRLPVWELMVMAAAAFALLLVLILWALFGYSWEITETTEPALEAVSLTALFL